jgi:replicative superfamily II helicase
MITRDTKSSVSIMNSIKLFLVDEVHLLGENEHGAAIEAAINRMKTYARKRRTEDNLDESPIPFFPA